MFPYDTIFRLTVINYVIQIGLCSVLLPTNGLASLPVSPLKPLDKGIDHKLSSLPVSSSSSVISSLPPSNSLLSSSSYRSSIPSLHHLPAHHQIPLTPIISPNQPHLSSGFSASSGLTSGLRAKLSPLLSFWSRNNSPKADKRALNLVRFREQYRRGLPNARALYDAILESHEERWMLNDPSLMAHYPPGHPHGMARASERKVGKVVNRIMSNFLADCVGVVISEIFRKMGEMAGELARLVVSNAASTVLGREDLSNSLRSSSSSTLLSSGKTVGRLIEAIKPKALHDKKTR